MDPLTLHISSSNVVHLCMDMHPVNLFTIFTQLIISHKVEVVSLSIHPLNFVVPSIVHFMPLKIDYYVPLHSCWISGNCLKNDFRRRLKSRLLHTSQDLPQIQISKCQWYHILFTSSFSCIWFEWEGDMSIHKWENVSGDMCTFSASISKTFFWAVIWKRPF